MLQTTKLILLYNTVQRARPTCMYSAVRHWKPSFSTRGKQFLIELNNKAPYKLFELGWFQQ